MKAVNFCWTKKTAVLIIVAAAVILAVIIILCSLPSGGITDAPGRVRYLASLGWQADPDSEEHREILMPESLNGVMAEYNRLQMQQGFDLRPYCGLTCSMYSYSVLNYPNGDPGVVAVLFIYKGRVIGGDIHSVAMDGFMHALTKN